MTDKELLDKVFDVAEDCGWYMGTAAEGGSLNLEFGRCTPAGQDFSFTLAVGFGFSADDLLSALDSYIGGFDVDYEAYIWIGEDGHGRNGAPFHIKDIVADMEAALAMVKDLRNALASVGVPE